MMRVNELYFKLSDDNVSCRLTFCQKESTFIYNVFYKKIVKLNNQTELTRNNVIFTCFLALYLLYILKLFISIFNFT